MDECIISYRYEEGKPWAIDLCERCYGKRLGDLIGKAHPVRRANIRPQYKMVETEVTPRQLGLG